MASSQSDSVRPDERSLRIGAIVREVTARRMVGQRVADEEIVAAHPDLQPELSDCLRVLARVEHARQRAAQDSSGQPPLDMKIGDETLPSAVSRGSVDGLPTGIWRYRILRKIGEGGMGTVYEAEQEKPRRIVALKVIRPGLATPQLLQRFEREAEVLGRLQHPGIAQIYEAGMADTGQGPQPFFAMEFIKGQSVLEYAQTLGQGTRQRMELMAKVCDAVQHAHQKGVIHRDLKPGNILVDESGQPKILDFGVARATDCDIQATTIKTDVGQLIGTIPYMSPEQVAADPNELDTRSDVYALGVILYELLAGRLPYDLRKKMIHEAVRMIRESEPTPLSSINRVFRGDVETIVAKALEKEKDRRYQSASAFASDIRRYLSDQPIAARPASATYQLRKFAKRNKAIVGGVASVFAILVGGTVVSTGQYLGAEAARREAVAARDETAEQRDRAVAAEREQFVQRREAEANAAKAREQEAVAKTEAAKSDAVNQFLQDMLSSVDPRAQGGKREVTVAEVLDKASERIENGALKDQLQIEAAVRTTIGATYRSLGRYAAAEPHLVTALRIRRSSLGDEHPDVAASIDNLAQLLMLQGKLSEAEPRFREALAIRRMHLGNEHTDLAASLNNLAALLRDQGKLSEAEPHFREALDINRKLHGGEHPDVAASLFNMGALLQFHGKLSEAEPLFREALAMWRKLLGSEHPDVAACLNNLGLLLRARGKPSEAEPLHREALDICRKLLGSEHPEVATHLNNLAAVLRVQGKLSEAESPCREALTMNWKLLGGEHPEVARNLNNLALLLQAQGKLSEADPLFREALAMRRKLLGEDHREVAQSLNCLAELLLIKGESSNAERLARQALGILRAQLPPGHVHIAATTNLLGCCLAEQGSFADAEPLLLEGYEAMNDHAGATPDAMRKALERIIKLYDSWNAAKPGTGYDGKAAEWRDKLSAWQATTQPADSQPGTAAP